MEPGPQGFSVWENVLDALTRIEERGTPLDDVLDSLRFPELRRTTASWLFTFYRRQCALTEYLQGFAPESPAPGLRRLMLLAAVRMRFQTAVAPQSCANAAVAFAKQKYGRGPGNFVNAFLRRIAREQPDLPVRLPATVAKRWKARFPEPVLAAFRECFAAEAPLTYRLCGENREGAAYGSGIPLPPGVSLNWHFFQTDAPGKLFADDLPGRGAVYVQDPAAALAPSLGQAAPVRTILDLCAAPGGKTLLLHERFPDAEITACDRSERRLARARENFQNHHLAVKTLTAKAEDLSLPGSFDWVLADVPCSNTGVFRRRPDALFRFSETALAETADLQRRILLNAARLVAPGGLLTYSTCSIEEEEDASQIAAFLSRHPEFRKEQEALLLPSVGHDGAYACALRRIR